MGYQEYEQEYGYLLPWDEAEKIVGRKLDWNNNYDCCLYHDLLVKKVEESKMEERRFEAKWEDVMFESNNDRLFEYLITQADYLASGVSSKNSMFKVMHEIYNMLEFIGKGHVGNLTAYIYYRKSMNVYEEFCIDDSPKETDEELELIDDGIIKVWRLKLYENHYELTELTTQKLAEPKYFKKVEYEVKLEKRETVYVMVECDADGDPIDDDNEPDNIMDYYLDDIASKFADDISEYDLEYTSIDDGYGNIMTAEDAQCDVGDCINEDDVEFEEEDDE